MVGALGKEPSPGVTTDAADEKDDEGDEKEGGSCANHDENFAALPVG